MTKLIKQKSGMLRVVYICTACIILLASLSISAFAVTPDFSDSKTAIVSEATDEATSSGAAEVGTEFYLYIDAPQGELPDTGYTRSNLVKYAIGAILSGGCYLACNIYDKKRNT